MSSFLVGLYGELVHLFPGDAVLLGYVLGGDAHGDHAVPCLLVVEDEGRELLGVDCGHHVAVGHALDAAADAEVVLVGPDSIRHVDHSLES
mmetsp:Transcript_10815/g.9541  ORF Transcript_10815/g.9541 Transcript_10815/m.9541 type:complete len:91 (-) Transcript_10815:54-326(-)